MILGILGKGFVGTAVFEGMKHAFDIISYDKGQAEKQKQSHVLSNKKYHGWEQHSPGIEELRRFDRLTGDIWRCGILERYGEGLIDPEGKETRWDKDNPYANMVAIADIIFVCVPTPMNPDGSCNTKIVREVIGELSHECEIGGHPKKIVCIKSTVVPGTTAEINERWHNLHVCYNPEFLTERNSIEDFKNQDRIIIGGPRDGTNILKWVYEKAYPDVQVTKTSSTVAELVKYMTNCFLATKVAFANEFQQISEALGEDYDKVVEYATKDKRLGASHWSVPGPDGLKGFGGSCLPKDLNALMHLANQVGVDPIVTTGAWIKNLDVRPEKDWEQLKGRAVTDPSES